MHEPYTCRHEVSAENHGKYHRGLVLRLLYCPTQSAAQGTTINFCQQGADGCFRWLIPWV